MTRSGCAGHGSLAEELRHYAGGAMDALEPLVERIREERPDPADEAPDSCASCPVCALITVLRGGRSELAVKLAEHLSDLISVLRTALDEGTGSDSEGEGSHRVRAESGAGPDRPTHRRPKVQRIPVTRMSA